MTTKVNASVEFQVNMTLTEIEARALDAIVGYGIKPFLEVFYKSLGKSYLQPHEKGAITLFQHIRSDLGQQLYNIDEAKKAISNLNVIKPIIAESKQLN